MQSLDLFSYFKKTRGLVGFDVELSKLRVLVGPGLQKVWGLVRDWRRDLREIRVTGVVLVRFGLQKVWRPVRDWRRDA